MSLSLQDQLRWAYVRRLRPVAPGVVEDWKRLVMPALRTHIAAGWAPRTAEHEAYCVACIQWLGESVLRDHQGDFKEGEITSWGWLANKAIHVRWVPESELGLKTIKLQMPTHTFTFQAEAYGMETPGEARERLMAAAKATIDEYIQQQTCNRAREPRMRTQSVSDVQRQAIDWSIEKRCLARSWAFLTSRAGTNQSTLRSAVMSVENTLCA